MSEATHSEESYTTPPEVSAARLSSKIDWLIKLSFSLTRGIEEAVVHGNRMALDQVFANLLSNAVKYTGEKGLVKVNVQKEQRSDTVRIDIADSGIGIPEESLPYIFDDFYRAPNAKSSGHQGTGLGLSIVKRIIDMHEGKVTVESHPIRGTQFSVFLPLIKAPPDLPNPSQDQLSRYGLFPSSTPRFESILGRQDLRDLIQHFLDIHRFLCEILNRHPILIDII